MAMATKHSQCFGVAGFFPQAVLPLNSSSTFNCDKSDQISSNTKSIFFGVRVSSVAALSPSVKVSLSSCEQVRRRTC